MLKFFRRRPPAEPNLEPAQAASTAPAEAGRRAPEAAETWTAQADVQPLPHDSDGLPDSAPVAVADPAPAADDAERATAQENSRSRWRARLAGSALARGVGGLFERNPRLDDALLDDLETVLIAADVGVATTTEVCEELRSRMRKREFADVEALRQGLREGLLRRIEASQQALDVSAAAPFVLLVVGVNGVGKTTTIGKLARHARTEGLQVMLAAGDTFRAAAVEQLQAWGERNHVQVVAQGQGADSASVIFDALQSARARGADLLIADTAGRLHTQAGLMDELGKIARVLKKIDADAPHEVLMVIDGSTGQNAIAQVRKFREMVEVTGLVVTKLDGTAKGGVVFALASEFGLPIRFIGLGEGIDDLRVFDARRYVDGLLPVGPGD